MKREIAHETLEAVIGAVVASLERAADLDADDLEDRVGELEGGVDTSECSADDIMADPRVYAAMRRLVDGTVGAFQSLGDE